MSSNPELTSEELAAARVDLLFINAEIRAEEKLEGPLYRAMEPLSRELVRNALVLGYMMGAGDQAK